MKNMLEKLLAKKAERNEGLTEAEISKKRRSTKFKINFVVLALVILALTSQVSIPNDYEVDCEARGLVEVNGSCEYPKELNGALNSEG